MKIKLLILQTICILSLLLVIGCQKQENKANTSNIKNADSVGTSVNMKKNILDTISDSEWLKLNVFVSNFCEADFQDFSIDGYNDKALVEFALKHYVVNNPKRFKSDEKGDLYLTKSVIDQVINKYFGISNIPVKEFEEDFYACHKGNYYWLDVIEGSSWFVGGQVIQAFDNGNGTFTVVVEKYVDKQGFDDAAADVLYKKTNSSFYAPKKNWDKKIEALLRPDGYYVAQIAPYSYSNQKDTYKLIKWNFAEKQEDIDGFIKSEKETKL